MSILKPGSLIFLQDYQTTQQNESTNYCLGIGSCNTRPKQRQHNAPLKKVEPFTWGVKRMDTVARTRQRLVEEGLEAALTRKHSPNSARKRIFDGAAEARLIALACSKAPAGRARWTLQMLEEKVVELKIVERASDNTIGRTLKKHSQAAPEGAVGHSSRRQCRVRGRHGRHTGRLSKAARP